MIVVKEPFRIGDVVTLKGSDLLMTVTCVADKEMLTAGFVLCSWHCDGAPMSSVYPEEALMRNSEAQQEADARALAGAVEHISAELANKVRECDELRQLSIELFADRKSAIDYAFKVYPEKRAETSHEAAQILAERYETLKREANEIIESLKK
jgi:uncharacterized protein YodC (DUF2158 family)